MAFAQKANDHESVSIYPYDNEQLEMICTLSGECVLNWSTKDGWPVGVMHAYVWHDGKFWITCGGHRHRVAALRRDPRCSVVISGKTAPPDSGCPTGTATAKGRAIIHENNQDVKDWFYAALSERLYGESAEKLYQDTPQAKKDQFVEFLDTPGRVIFEFKIEKTISFDGDKIDIDIDTPDSNAHGE